MNCTSLSGSHLSLVSSSSVLKSIVSSQRLWHPWNCFFCPASPVPELSVTSQVWSRSNLSKCVFTTLLMKPNVEEMVLPEKSLCWWCSCISLPGPERPYQPKTVVSPQSHPELRKKNGYRWRLRGEIISTGLFVPSWNLSLSSVSGLCPLVEATGVSSSWPVDIIFWSRLFSFSKSPKKFKSKTERFNKSSHLNFAMQAHRF